MFQNHFQRKPASFHFKLTFMVKTLLLLFLGSNFGVRAQSAADCVAGLYWDGTTCKRCQGGKVSLSNGATSCENCTTGKHSYGVGAGETCRNCTKGKHQSEHGVAYCNKCQAGRYNDKVSAATCDSCPPGRYQEEVGQTFCDDCPKGFHSWNELISEKDASSCEGCIPGMYGETDGSIDITDCKNCSAGRYSTHVGYPTFNSYPLGYTADLPCAPCAFGKWSSEQGMPNLIGCISCKIGYYNEKEGSDSISSCKICASGRYMTNFGSYNSKDCNICVSFLLLLPSFGTYRYRLLLLLVALSHQTHILVIFFIAKRLQSRSRGEKLLPTVFCRTALARKRCRNMHKVYCWNI